MIDVEIDVFDRVARAILKECPGAYVSSMHVTAPPQFPAVSLIETSNIEQASMADSSDGENASAVAYTMNVYSNSATSAKEECRRIAAIASAEMRAMNMTRLMCEPIDNAADPSIYRIVARYAGLVDKNHVMYRR